MFICLQVSTRATILSKAGFVIFLRQKLLSDISRNLIPKEQEKVVGNILHIPVVTIIWFIMLYLFESFFISCISHFDYGCTYNFKIIKKYIYKY